MQQEIRMTGLLNLSATTRFRRKKSKGTSSGVKRRGWSGRTKATKSAVRPERAKWTEMEIRIQIGR
jgi:hypothetical protein